MTIKVKTKDSYKFEDKEVKHVLPVIRSMSEGTTVLFPYDYREAVKTACSILRTKEGLSVQSKIWYHNYEKYMRVIKQESAHS